MMRTYGNFQREDWELFFEFAIAAAQMDPNDKNSSVLSMEVEPVTATEQKFWKFADQRLDATLVTRPIRSPVTTRGGTSHIDKSFW